MDQEDGNHGNGDNGNDESSQNEREGSSERETGEEEKMEGEGEAGSEEETEKDSAEAVDSVQDLFTLSAVNAYGSQEVKKIEDEPSKVYTLTSESTAPPGTSVYYTTSVWYPNLYRPYTM